MNNLQPHEQARELYTAVIDAAARGQKVMALIRECFRVDDKYTITTAAQMIDTCPRFDAKMKADRLSALRMAIGRVCKELDTPKLTVKKVSGQFELVEATKRADKTTDFQAALWKLLEKAQEEGQLLTFVNGVAEVALTAKDLVDAEQGVIEGEGE